MTSEPRRSSFATVESPVRVRRTSNGAIVRATEIIPDSLCIVTFDITTPAHLVRVEKIRGPLDVEWYPTKRYCEE